MKARAKHFEYWISLDDGAVSAEGHPVTVDADLSAEHLLLAALARCSISSLEHFARQKNLEVRASAYAAGTVTRRGDEDRYGFVSIECKLDARIDPEPPEAELRPLLHSAEWGCFIGASLQPPPRYSWRVNGRDL
ncbi:MAG TPA: OsmC family protein [Gaiellaceae bacterium]|jgi:organic hydroperoxide reductase OsmC/OhrA|nr:OsmC family protein [Gaiellaceae bacterium]